jgi:hypothetical protein
VIRAALVTLVLATAVPAAAQDKRSQALELAGEAMDLVDAGDFRAALGKFEQADGLVPAPTLKLEMARCLDRLDRLLDAAAKYREVIATELTSKSPAPHHEARKAAVKELQALLEQIPTLTVTVLGAGADDAGVRLGERTLEKSELGQKLSLDPGSYVVEAVAGERRDDEAVTLGRREHKQVALELEAPEVEPVEPVPVEADGGGLRAAGWVSIALGGAALSVGSILGVVVLTEESGLLERCPERQCPPEAHDDARAFDRMRIGSTAALIVGGAGVAVGIVVLLAAPSAQGDVAIGPHGIGARF